MREAKFLYKTSHQHMDENMNKNISWTRSYCCLYCSFIY